MDVERIYSLFPRLAGRRRTAGRLSGGERRDCNGRALLVTRVCGNGRATEGLAPGIVEQAGTLKRSRMHVRSDRDRVLLIERTSALRSCCRRIAVMVTGELRARCRRVSCRRHRVAAAMLGVPRAVTRTASLSPDVTEDEDRRVYSPWPAHADAAPSISPPDGQKLHALGMHAARHPCRSRIRPSLDTAKEFEPKSKPPQNYVNARRRRLRVPAAIRARLLHCRQICY